MLCFGISKEPNTVAVFGAPLNPLHCVLYDTPTMLPCTPAVDGLWYIPCRSYIDEVCNCWAVTCATAPRKKRINIECLIIFYLKVGYLNIVTSPFMNMVLLVIVV